MAMEKFKASVLPSPPKDYDAEYLFQLIRILGLYFSQLDSKTPLQNDSYRGLNFYGGNFFGEGYGLKLPHIAASDSTDQIAGGNDTPTAVKWDTLDSGYEWTLTAPGSASPDFSGVYKITYSLQFINTANAAHYATVWLKVNNNDLANSATTFLISGRKSATEFAYIAAYSEVTFEVQAGDDIELYWATDLAGDPNPLAPVEGVYMFHDPVQTTPYARPAIPSAIGSITFVSAIP